MEVAHRITFRDCRGLDWRRVASLISGIFPSEPPGAIGHALRAQNTRLCLRDKRIVGFYVYQPARGDGELWLDYIGVETGVRRGGLGKLLLADLEEQARKRGFFRIALGVDTDNAGAIAFYERNDFRRSAPSGDGRRTFYSKLIVLQPGVTPYKARAPLALFDLPIRAYRKLQYWIVVGAED